MNTTSTIASCLLMSLVWPLVAQEPAAKAVALEAAQLVRVQGETEAGDPLGTLTHWKQVPPWLAKARCMAQTDQPEPPNAFTVRDGVWIPNHPVPGPAWLLKSAGTVVVAALRPTKLPKTSSLEAAEQYFLNQQGWTPVATVAKEERTRTDSLVLFKRTFSSKEKFAFQSEFYPSYFVIKLDGVPLQDVLAAPSQLMALHPLEVLGPVPKRRRGDREDTSGRFSLVLNHDTYEPVPLLTREIARQAVLIAARDELGLLTSDDSLREPISRKNEDATKKSVLETVVSDTKHGTNFLVSVLRADETRPVILGEFALDFPNATHNWQQTPLPLDEIVEKCELWSRTELVEVLKKAGWENRLPEPAADKGSPAADFESSLYDLNPIAQFVLIRRLHSEIREHGESAVRLDALARAYANLGALTDYTWGAQCQVYKARALLYAERLKVREKGNVQSILTRAYVRSVIGNHALGLKDLNEAMRLLKDHVTQGGKFAMPRWFLVIHALCEFDRKRLNQFDVNKLAQPLTRYAVALIEEYSVGNRIKCQAALAALEVSPYNFHALDMLSREAPLTYVRRYTAESIHRTLKGACGPLNNLPGGTPELLAFCKKWAVEPSDDDDDQVDQQAELLELLTNPEELKKDLGEPSLGSLAALLREIQFVQVLRLVQIERDQLKVPSDDTLDHYRLLFKDHPYADFLRVSRRKSEIPVAELRTRLLEMDRTDWGVKEQEIPKVLLQIKQPGYEFDYGRLASRRGSWTYFEGGMVDYFKRTPKIENGFRADWTKISPKNFLAVAAGIRNGSGESDSLAKYEQQYAADFTILFHLLERHVKDKRPEAVVRCAKKLIEMAPAEPLPYVFLANHYSEKQEWGPWKETLDGFLKTEDSGLEHAQVRVTIAKHLIAGNERDEAKAYAYKAAESGAQWALSVAADCAMLTGEWDRAEEFLRQTAERYGGATYLQWYCLCRRIKHANTEFAREATEPIIEAMTQQDAARYLNNRVLFYRLSGDNEAALEACLGFAEFTQDPVWEMEAALLAGELKQVDLRDKLLKHLQEGDRLPQYDWNGYLTIRGETKMLADQFAAYLAAGKQAKFSDEVYRKNTKRANASYRSKLNLWVGHLLLSQGNQEEAIKYLRLAATSSMASIDRDIAAALLTDLKVEIGPLRNSE